ARPRLAGCGPARARAFRASRQGGDAGARRALAAMAWRRRSAAMGILRRPQAAAHRRAGVSEAIPGLASRGKVGSDRPSGDGTAELVLDVDADDLLEAGVGLEAELQRPLGCELARPAGNDALHERIGHAADASHDLVTGHVPEGRDLLTDRDGEARHGERAAP